MKRIACLMVMLCVACLSCQQLPTNNPNPNINPTGLLTLRISNTNASPQSARVLVRQKAVQTQGTLRPTDAVFTATTTAARENDTAFDYIQVQFAVQNTSATAFNNLTLYAVAKAGNIGGTAIKNITTFGGLADVTEQIRIAKLVTPTHGIKVNATFPTLSLIAGREDFQAFEASEVDALQNDPNWTSPANGFSSNDKVLGYGYVARYCTADCASPNPTFTRTIPAGQSGFMNIALRIPRSSGTAYDFVMTFAVVDEPTIRVTKSLYPPESLSSAEARLTALGGTSTSQLMQLGLRRNQTPSSNFINKGTDELLVTNDTTNASYFALGLGRISTGFNHTCALSSSGKAYCWGDNLNGHLGDGTFAAKSIPTLVSGNLTFSSISAGFGYTCGITTSGAAYCWGYNFSEQLGIGCCIPTPQLVSGNLTFLSISAGAGSSHTCGIITTGAAYCWGTNFVGELGIGDNTQTGRRVPTLVSGNLTFSSISAGRSHTCGITTTGAAYCWGGNANGNLGDNTNTNKLVPTLVSGNLTFSSISAGSYHTCGITTTGTAYCWGNNGSGQLGDNSTNTRNTPALVDGTLRFSSISTGEFHTCAVSTNGTPYCWGSNQNGQLATNGSNDYVPGVVTGGLKFSSISAGIAHTCGVASSGAPYCWGKNSDGQLGNNSYNRGDVPTFVVNTSLMISSLSAGYSHTCGFTPNGLAYCWGNNGNGQLGNNSLSNSNVPTLVNTLEPFSSIKAGGGHTCGLTSVGKAYCWGENAYGQLGDNTTTDRPVPTLVNGNLRFSSLALGNFHTCGLTTNGTAYCWGFNDVGQLGETSTTNRLVPTLVSGGLTFSSISVGLRHNCALTANGTAYCWGFNGSGQLGDNSTTTRNTPTLVDGTLRFSNISTGDSHTCAVTVTNGTAYCWGFNDNWQLGDNTQISKSVPTLVDGGLSFSSIHIGTNTSCALSTTGAAYCWGRSDIGQLGSPGFDFGDPGDASPVPNLVFGNRTYSSLSSSGNHTCGLTSGGTYCWGWNFAGQLGNGNLANQNVPTAVSNANFPWKLGSFGASGFNVR